MSIQIFYAISQPEKIAEFINDHQVDQNHFFTYKVYQSHSLDFYSNGRVKELKDSINLQKLPVNEVFYVYTNSIGLTSMKNNGFNFTKLLEVDNYSVTKLTLKFLNPNTRATTTEKRFLVKVEKSVF